MGVSHGLLLQGDILAKFGKEVLGQPSLLSLKHYHRPLVCALCLLAAPQIVDENNPASCTSFITL